MLAFFVWELLMLGILVALTVYMLAAKTTPWHVYISVWVSWAFALFLVALANNSQKSSYSDYIYIASRALTFENVCQVPIDIHIVYLKRCIAHFGNNTAAQEEACSVIS
jgi:hypothetical protein